MEKKKKIVAVEATCFCQYPRLREEQWAVDCSPPFLGGWHLWIPIMDDRVLIPSGEVCWKCEGNYYLCNPRHLPDYQGYLLLSEMEPDEFFPQWYLSLGKETKEGTGWEYLFEIFPCLPRTLAEEVEKVLLRR